MKIHAILSTGIAALLVAGSAAFAAEGNAEAGKAKTSMCAGCHGIDGYKIAYPSVYNVPKLGGQHAAYIVAALREYKQGERNSETMRAIASTLSDQDMADVAAYYASTAPSGGGK